MVMVLLASSRTRRRGPDRSAGQRNLPRVQVGRSDAFDRCADRFRRFRRILVSFALRSDVVQQTAIFGTDINRIFHNPPRHIVQIDSGNRLVGFESLVQMVQPIGQYVVVPQVDTLQRRVSTKLDDLRHNLSTIVGKMSTLQAEICQTIIGLEAVLDASDKLIAQQIATNVEDFQRRRVLDQIGKHIRRMPRDLIVPQD